ncbi:hypothetical protein P4O66_006691, partial [Electrophorus voltai]
ISMSSAKQKKRVWGSGRENSCPSLGSPGGHVQPFKAPTHRYLPTTKTSSRSISLCFPPYAFHYCHGNNHYLTCSLYGRET